MSCSSLAMPPSLAQLCITHHAPATRTTAPNLASASKSNDNCHRNFRGTLVKCYNVSIILQIVFLIVFKYYATYKATAKNFNKFQKLGIEN